MGQPVSRETFFETNVEALRQSQWIEIGNRMPGKKHQAKREESFKAVMHPIWETIQAIPTADPDSVQTLTLAEASVLPTQGDGLSVRSLRVSLSAVAGWWIDGAEKLTTRGSSSFFLGGFMTVEE